MSRLTIENALASLGGQAQPFKELFSHGSLSVDFPKSSQRLSSFFS